MVLTEVMNYLATILLPLVWHIFLVPWQSGDTLWMILPLILILVLIHLYFGRYKTEELGWNTALGNSISLLWICVILFRYFFETSDLTKVFVEEALLEKFILLALMAAWVLLLVFFNFFHVFPKRAAFMISSADGIYVMAYILIALVGGDIPLNRDTILASIVLYLLVVGILQFLKFLVPPAEEVKKELEKEEKEEMHEKAARKAVRTRRIHRLEDRIKKFWKSIKKKFDKALVFLHLKKK